MKLSKLSLFIASIYLIGCSLSTVETMLTSPGNVNSIVFSLDANGAATYQIHHHGALVVKPSLLSFEFKDQEPLQDRLEILKSSEQSVNETWEMPWGEQRQVVNQYNELKIELQESQAPNRKFNIYFRAYDDGIALRYEFLSQEGRDSVYITEERTRFNLTGDHTAWWIPGDWDIYEHKYNTSKLSDLDAIAKRNHPNLAQTYIPENAVNTPVTMRTEDGLHLSFHEANLTDYAGMTLMVNTEDFSLTSNLVGSQLREEKVGRGLPFMTPWRTIQIADEAKDLIASNLIVNLNEPNRLGSVEWFKPMKYVGIWWEMHIGKSTWDYAGSQDMNTFVGTSEPHGRHGATTENTKRYIDFAAANGIGGVLVEGWNTGWERWIGFEDREGVFDFITPYPDYDLEEVVRYAKSKGVEIVMHHETSAAPRTYDQQMDTAYALMNRLGIHSVKTGYVGKIIPKGEYHHGQWMVKHYRKVLEKAAAQKIAINAHEPIKATGIRRTLPNAISREGLRGQEFNAWATDGGNPPEHLPIVAFTRMLAGPIDFTPGVFEISLNTKPDNQINTTLAQQLALYVVIYSPIQMACDLPENYENQPAFQFIRDVGVDWEKTVVLDGEVGDFVSIAREERETGNWFVGAITDETARTVEINFDFLPEGQDFIATLYRDGPKAHFRDNPLDIVIETKDVNKLTSLAFDLAPGGGLAISLIGN